MKQLLAAACLCMASLYSFAQAPNITAEPVDAEACAGSDTSFVVTATGTGLTYQWQVNMGGFFLNLSDDGFHTGSNNDTLQLTGINGILDGLQYRCVVSGSVSPNDTSATVTLTVGEAPNVISQPNFQVICDGGNANFTVSASGAGVTYQWQESTDDGTSYSNVVNGGIYSNATTASLDLTGATGTQDGYLYRCVVTNACGTDSSDAGALLVDVALSIAQLLALVYSELRF